MVILLIENLDERVWKTDMIEDQTKEGNRHPVDRAGALCFGEAGQMNQEAEPCPTAHRERHVLNMHLG